VKQLTNEQKQKIQQMRLIEQSYMQISSTLCISENTIKSYCRRNNLGTIENSRPQAVMEIHTACKNCGKPLMQETRGQPKKFCSEECRRNWWKTNDSQLFKKAFYTITCVGCGKEFESYGNKSRKFCGHACYIKYRFKKEMDFNDTGAV
jgi:endogenous inhibitor of DNA gyrase (YacG/DUF329 family)